MSLRSERDIPFSFVRVRRGGRPCWEQVGNSAAPILAPCPHQHGCTRCRHPSRPRGPQGRTAMLGAGRMPCRADYSTMPPVARLRSLPPPVMAAGSAGADGQNGRRPDALPFQFQHHAPAGTAMLAATTRHGCPPERTHHAPAGTAAPASTSRYGRGVRRGGLPYWEQAGCPAVLIIAPCPRWQGYARGHL